MPARAMYRRAIVDAVLYLDPRNMVRNPVMFVVEVGSVLTTFLFIQALAGKGEAPTGFIGAVTLWLWLTVIFANFSQALAEGRGKARAEALRRPAKANQRQETPRTDARSGATAASTTTWWLRQTYGAVTITSSRPATPSRPTAK